MARCLAPIELPNPAVWEKRQLVWLKDMPTLSKYGRDNIRPMRSEFLTVPCGKCIACQKNKQGSMVVRCLREAGHRGSFGFMTLTYDDDHLPLMESMWRVNLRDGSEEQVETAEFVSTGFHPEPAYLDLFRSVDGSSKPRYKTFVHCRLMEYEWQIRVTPSVCRLDVRQWLKQARIQYKRDFGKALPDFSYVAVQEYGSRTCRPHYHLAFFGLKKIHLDYLLDRWRFGKVKQVRMVQVVNKDKSSGFIKASKYIGKYMKKGDFECDSVKCCDAEKPRVCQSLHFGTKNLSSIEDYLLCRDMVGTYDIDTLVKSDGVPLSCVQVDALVNEIPRRLVYKVDDKTTFPIPRVIRDKVFKVVDNESGKKVSSALWQMVAAVIRDNAARDRDEQFRQFCSANPSRSLSENYAGFQIWTEFCSSVQKQVMQTDLQSFYASSHF